MFHMTHTCSITLSVPNDSVRVRRCYQWDPHIQFGLDLVSIYSPLLAQTSLVNYFSTISSLNRFWYLFLHQIQLGPALVLFLHQIQFGPVIVSITRTHLVWTSFGIYFSTIFSLDLLWYLFLRHIQFGPVFGIYCSETSSLDQFWYIFLLSPVC